MRCTGFFNSVAGLFLVVDSGGAVVDAGTDRKTTRKYVDTRKLYYVVRGPQLQYEWTVQIGVVELWYVWPRMP